MIMIVVHLLDHTSEHVKKTSLLKAIKTLFKL